MTQPDVYSIDHDAFQAWNEGKHRQALDAWDRLLDERPDFPESDRPRIERNRRYAIHALNQTFSQYPYDVVDDLVRIQDARNRDPSRRPSVGITFVILTCKRYDLFTRTMNSFLRHCTDLELISRWICVDDNSHPTERAAMKAIYPFMEFVFKQPEDVGHARSLNMLRQRVDTPYVFALEDDWLFVRRMDYVSRMLRIFDREPGHLKQVLINRHYAEVPDDSYLSLRGGILKRDFDGKRYILHEHVPVGTAEYAEYCSRYPANFAHQPHFALRPAMFKTEVWKELGEFDESPDVDFETQYARSYAARGFTSAYLDGIYCVHIGRLNRDKHDPDAAPNAYQLNDQPQYGHRWKTNRGNPKKLPEERVILTATTCKRLGPFLKSMRTVLSMCRDVHVIDKFLIVDDNSSEEDRAAMKTAFPFFDFILKGPEQKGHAKSMNIILDACKGYDYAFHNEDDWDFRQQYSLGDAIVLLREHGMAQVTLKWHDYCTATREEFKGISYRAHYHSLHDPNVPWFFRKWRDAFLTQEEYEENRKISGGCWWPTFSLYPSVWNMRSIEETGERFDEDMDPTYFEYAISFRLWKHGWRVCMLDIEMSQYPCMTAYLLNDHLRTFDQGGCAVHRAINRDPNCAACAEQQEGWDALQRKKKEEKSSQ
jgi:hypothetical protein